MPPAGFEPTIPACDRPNAHILDPAATSISGDGLIQAGTSCPKENVYYMILYITVYFVMCYSI
jgi:hypothetical protein